MVNAVVYVICVHTGASQTFAEGLKTGAAIAEYVIPVYSLIVMGILSFGILSSKKILKHIGAILLALCATLITPIFGGVIGMIFLAILTSFNNENTSNIQ